MIKTGMEGAEGVRSCLRDFGVASARFRGFWRAVVTFPVVDFGVELRLVHLRAREGGSAQGGARVKTWSYLPDTVFKDWRQRLRRRPKRGGGVDFGPFVPSRCTNDIPRVSNVDEL